MTIFNEFDKFLQDGADFNKTILKEFPKIFKRYVKNQNSSQIDKIFLISSKYTEKSLNNCIDN
jgi:hypothetical protein